MALHMQYRLAMFWISHRRTDGRRYLIVTQDSHKALFSTVWGLIVLVLITSLSHWNCGRNSVEVPPKNPREYEWTIDTIAYPGSFQTMMIDIWGSSSGNLYIVGHNDRGLGLMWHYDGAKWTDVKLGAAQGGKIDQAINLYSVFGTGSNSIWAVGMMLDLNPHPPPTFVDSSLIIHFDGLQWKEAKIERGGPLRSISGCDAREVWTCGARGTIYHYDGTSWVKDSVPSQIVPNQDLSFGQIKVKSRSEAFMIGATIPNAPTGITYYFFRRKNDLWNVASSFSFQSGEFENRFGIYGLWLSPEGTLYSFDSMVSKWTGTSWVKLYDRSSALRRMGGTSESNFFVVGDFGEVLHFNGIDWFEYPQLKNSDAVYSSVWTDESQVFVVGYVNDGSKTIILHGK